MQANKSSINYILGSDSLTVYLEGKSFTINKQAHTYGIVLDAVKQNNIAGLKQALDVKKTITSMLSKSSDKVKIEGNKIFYMDREVQGLISSRIFEMLRLELDVTPMVLFLENLMSNPSKRAVDELFGFLEACTLPITPDGCFLAYKRVREDYMDVYSGTMDNSVGKIVELPRNVVDEDSSRTCSTGLHACSYSYLKHFAGARVVAVKINPRDVVSIPKDYNNSKLRCCRYEVVEEIELDSSSLPSTPLNEGYVSNHGSSDLSIRNNLIISHKLKGLSIKELCIKFSLSRRQIRRICNGTK